MQQMMDFVSANPLYAVGFVLLLVLLVVGLVKRAAKMVLAAVLLNIGYGYYLQDMAATAYAKAADSVQDVTEQAKDAAAKTGEMLQIK